MIYQRFWNETVLHLWETTPDLHDADAVFGWLSEVADLVALAPIEQQAIVLDGLADAFARRNDIESRRVLKTIAQMVGIVETERASVWARPHRQPVTVTKGDL
jgi:hypothetical protein